MASTQFKVGDRVTALAGKPVLGETEASVPQPQFVGKTGTVIRVDDPGLSVAFPDGTEDYAWFRFWAKAPEFSVGDRVRVKTGMEDYRGPGGVPGFGRLGKGGKTGVITSTFTGFVTGILQPLVKFDDMGYNESGFFDELEAVSAEFKPGDQVRVKPSNPQYRGPKGAIGFDSDSHGKEGEVLRVYIGNISDAPKCWVRFPDGREDSGFTDELDAVTMRTPAAEFKPGDVVTLKSGGPKMTVAREDSLGVFVDYFDAGNFYHRSFSKAVLCRVPQ